MEYELSHAGIKGMKWGVRKNKRLSSGSSRPRAGTTKTQKSANDFRSASIKVSKTKRGAKVVAKHNNAKVKVIVSNTANVAAGALRVASAFIPGAGALSGVANAAALIGTVANVALK